MTVVLKVNRITEKTNNNVKQVSGAHGRGKEEVIRAKAVTYY